MTTNADTNPNAGVSPSDGAADKGGAPVDPNNQDQIVEGNDEDEDEFFNLDEVKDEADQEDDDDEDGPAEGEDGEGKEADADKPQGEEGQADADGQVDIEWEGKAFKIPAVLKDAFMKNADYTQKTQALSKDRASLEAVQKRFATQHANAVANLQDAADLRSLHAEIKSYDDTKWAELQQSDPDLAATEWRRLTLLKEEAGKLATKIKTGETAALEAAEREDADQLQKAIETCAKDIPGWSAEYAGQLGQHAAADYGFTADEVQAIRDPRVFKALHSAMEGKKAIAELKQLKATLAKANKLQQNRPAQQVKTGSQGAAPTGGDPARMTPGQYHRWRQGQIAKGGK